MVFILCCSSFSVLLSCIPLFRCKSCSLNHEKILAQQSSPHFEVDKTIDSSFTCFQVLCSFGTLSHRAGTHHQKCEGCVCVRLGVMTLLFFQGAPQKSRQVEDEPTPPSKSRLSVISLTTGFFLGAPRGNDITAGFNGTYAVNVERTCAFKWLGHTRNFECQ